MKTFLIFFLSLLPTILYSQKFENLAKTPPMGWSSWNKFGCEINEDIIKSVADAMISTGMKEAGYEYINIDDCWQSDKRDESGNIIANSKKFPSGIKSLADYIHSKGLRLGIYSCAGEKTCAGFPGSRGHEFQDAKTFASWGIDYLKYDWCNTYTQNAEASYIIMSQAIREAGRPIVFSICEWGKSEPWIWAKNVGHLWRTSGDIQDCWDCTKSWGGEGWLKILDKQTKLSSYAGPGAWNDPDMLEVGNGNMTDAEYKAHFSIWCMISAPLIAGNDLRNMSEESKEILTNKAVISVDQDILGLQGFIAYKDSKLEIWMKKLSGGNIAVCFFNRSDNNIPLNINWQTFWGHEGIYGNGFTQFQIDKSYRIIDLWNKNYIGTTSDSFKADLGKHSVIHLKLEKQ
jgi:alpha-galactosidase